MFDDFKLDNEYTPEEKPKFFGLSKLQIIMIAIILFFIIILIINSISNNSKDIRLDRSKDIVYTSYKSDKYAQEIPYINIKGDSILKVNEDLQEYTKEFKNNKYSKISYEYQYGNGFQNLLSLIITMKYDRNDIHKVYYASYNIDTNQKRQISNNDLLKAYGLTRKDVDKIVEEEFKNFYEDEIDNEYFERGECDFSCYMKLRKYSSIDDIDFSYYVDEDSILKLYLPFEEDSIFEEHNYFSDEDHIFEIKDKPE